MAATASTGAGGATGADANPAPAVQAALQALYQSTDNQARRTADQWLRDFQKTPQAWQTANELLLAMDQPVEARLFAAQTFRSKVVYDLDQVPKASLPSLRDTLLNALEAYGAGPRVLQTQVALALSALALQMTDWQRPVPAVIERFGNNPAMVPALLELLSVLPEEIVTNHRIPVDEITYHQRVTEVLTAHVDDVLKLLSLYATAKGVTSQIQNGVFNCLASWLKSGEISISTFAGTPLFDLCFQALASDELFDVAIDCICDLIHETQEVHENMGVIEQIVPRLAPLREALTQAIADEDDDKVRGLCRVLVQAGESYHVLILQHQDIFLPIIEAIAICASYNNLDIVQITFRFWYLLASPLSKARREDPNLQSFFAVYERLLDTITGHLRFPPDDSPLTGQEYDDFKSFRHHMGDTLKDCCAVLGPQECLSRALSMMQAAMATASGETFQWQAVEAPLFSMRAMGSRADPSDDTVIPLIMDIIPTLPAHPKLQYAALLVVSRYTEWVNRHPERIPAVLTYVSSGLSATDADVAAAAAQALNYLCQDCSQHLLPFLPQLYEFFGTIDEQLGPDDLIAISEAVAHIITGLKSTAEAVEPMQRFTHPILTKLEAAASTALERDQLRKVADRLEQLEKFLGVIGSRYWADFNAAECAQTCSASYAIVDAILERYGQHYFISERVAGLLRRSLIFWGDLIIPTLPAILARLSASFEQTGFGGYIWIVGKIIDGFSRKADQSLAAAMQKAFEQVSHKVTSVVAAVGPEREQDVVEDFVHTCAAVAGNCPKVLYLSPVFPDAFRIALAALTLNRPEIVDTALTFIREIVGHDALSMVPNNSAPGTPLTPVYPGAASGLLVGAVASETSPQELIAFANNIRSVIQSQGFELCSLILNGLVSHFSSDCLPLVVSVIRVLSSLFPAEMSAWIPAATEAITSRSISTVERQNFAQAYTSALAGQNLDQIKPAITSLFSAARRAQDRARANR